MKPGDEGGWLPSIWRFRRRHQRKQPKRSAAMLRVPRGTPRPMASFSLRLRLESLGAGATVSVGVLLGGAEVRAEVEIEAVDEDLGVCREEEDDDVEDEDDDDDKEEADDVKDVAEGDGLLRVWLGKAVKAGLVFVDESAVALVSCDPHVDLAVLEICHGFVSVG